MPTSWVQANANQAQGIADEEYLELRSTDLRPPCGPCYAAPAVEATALGPCILGCRQSEPCEDISAVRIELSAAAPCLIPPCRQSEDYEEVQAAHLPPPPMYCRQSA